jgi:macrolide-specific efflux system membrane fusion protein
MSAGGAVSTAVYYNGLFNIANPDHQLRPAMTAQVDIVLDEANHALVIPVGALGDTQPDGRRMVQVMDPNGHIHPRTVQVGINNHVMAEVLSGLTAGERVIVSNSAAPGAAKP